MSDTLFLAFAFIAGVEAIFLTDLIINRILPRVLENGASLVNVLVLVVLSLPSSLYIAMPVALLAAVYFVVLRRRETREFIVFAGMGQGVGRLVGFGLVLGVLALVLSLFVSGHVEPLARYEAGRTMFNVRLEALRTGAIGAGKFYQHDDFTIFAGAGKTSSVANNVFFLQSVEADRYRLVTASQSNRLNAPEMTNAGVVLRDAAAYDFEIESAGADCADCPALSVVPRAARASSQILIELPDLVFDEVDPRGTRIAERTSLELLSDDLGRRAVRSELIERLYRGLLVLLTPLLAIVAVALTRPANFLLVLPAAAGLVLAGSFFGSRLVDLLLPLGFATSASALISGAVLALTVLVYLVFRNERGCIQNGGVQL